MCDACHAPVASTAERAVTFYLCVPSLCWKVHSGEAAQCWLNVKAAEG